MATVTLTFKDEEDGGMSTTCEFDPPLDREDREAGTLSPAHATGAAMLQVLMEMSEEVEEGEE